MSKSHNSGLEDVDYLIDIKSKISVMYNGNPTPKELGNIALEIIIKRNELYIMLEKQQDHNMKTEIESQIKELADLERIITSMYMLNKTHVRSVSNVWSSQYESPKFELWKGLTH